MVQFTYDYLGFFILQWLLKWSLVSNSHFYETPLHKTQAVSGSCFKGKWMSDFFQGHLWVPGDLSFSFYFM